MGHEKNIHYIYAEEIVRHVLDGKGWRMRKGRIKNLRRGLKLNNNS